MRVSDRTRARSSCGCTGFDRNSSAPASSPRIRSERSVCPVTSTTGVSRVAGSAFSRRQTSRPSTRGIVTSSRMTSGWWSRTASSAAAPSSALTTSWPSASSSLRNSDRMLSVSSAMSTRLRRGAGRSHVTHDTRPKGTIGSSGARLDCGHCGVESVTLELPVERAPADAEQARRHGFVAVDLFECADDVLTLDLRQRRRPWAWRPRRGVDSAPRGRPPESAA